MLVSVWWQWLAFMQTFMSVFLPSGSCLVGSQLLNIRKQNATIHLLQTIVIWYTHPGPCTHMYSSTRATNCTNVYSGWLNENVWSGIRVHLLASYTANGIYNLILSVTNLVFDAVKGGGHLFKTNVIILQPYLALLHFEWVCWTIRVGFYS